jgi:hypothetical protein
MQISGRDQTSQCGNCGTPVKLCANNSSHQICNASVLESDEETLCRYCRLTESLPDLTVKKNVKLWKKMELAKHRVLYDYERAGFPFSVQLPEGKRTFLSLRFYFPSSEDEPVITGHENGKITIDLLEADSVKREENRVGLRERQRTLVGHFRHELGHFVWQILVEPKADKLAGFRELFGDETAVDYAKALESYYESGPNPAWSDSFISQYASSHPWEDFAETFRTFLDIRSIVSTAEHFGLTSYQGAFDSFDKMIEVFRHVSVSANELNRDMGLIDLVPSVLNDRVERKVEFIHGLATKVTFDSPA